MGISETRMLQRYDHRLDPERITEDLTANKPTMVALMTVVTNEMVTIEDRIKGVLSGEAVAVTDHYKYLAFGRVLYRMQRRYGGGTGLSNIVEFTKNTYVNDHGCTESVLERIRDEVFAIPEP